MNAEGNSKIDLLNDWHIKMSELSWKNVMFQNPNMNVAVLRFIVDRIRHFFPESSFCIERYLGKTNIGWLHNYLAMTDINFVAYAKELAVIIDYYNRLFSGNDPLHIKPNSYELLGLKDRLFELLVNYILHQNGFNNKLDFSYYAGSIKKPVDSYFEYNNVGYIIECAKIYDTKKTALLKTTQRVIRKVLTQNGKLISIRTDIQPCGYILFKHEKNVRSIANKIETKFSDQLKVYLNNMNERSDVINPHSRIETDDYAIFIGSNIIYDINKYKELLGKYDLALTFDCKLKSERLEGATFSITAQSKTSLSYYYELITEIIKSKTKQHLHATGFKQIIFIELEEGIAHTDIEMPLYISIEDIDFSIFDKYINETVSLFFLFKIYRNTNAYYNTKFLCHSDFNPVLADRIKKLKIQI